MKNYKRYVTNVLVVTIGSFFIANHCLCQTIFYFVAPNSTISTNFAVGLDSVDCPGGYSKVQVTAANVAIFNRVAPSMIKYVYAQLQPGTRVRDNLNLIMLNSSGRVRTIQYWLADDRTSFNVPGNENMAGMFLPYPDDNPKKYVWPAAFNYNFGGNDLIGIVGLGEHQLQSDQSGRTGQMSAVDEVILHESSHTQFISSSKWQEGTAITYGADGAHFSYDELLGDQEGALDEGLATFYGYILNDVALQELVDNYADSSHHRYFVEGRSVLAGQPDLYSIPRIQTPLMVPDQNGQLVISRYANGDAVTIFTYSWREVPGWYLLFNEGVSTLFFSFFRNHTYHNKDTALSMIRNTAQAMSPERRKRFLTYACNRLALKMEDYNNSTTGRADTSRTSSLFPFAVLDLLTHFGMSETEYQADYRRNNADRDPLACAEYFRRRNIIRALVQADIDAGPIRFREALGKIIAYCKNPVNIL